jgi:hypothetical protein
MTQFKNKDSMYFPADATVLLSSAVLMRYFTHGTRRILENIKSVFAVIIVNVLTLTKLFHTCPINTAYRAWIRGKRLRP